MSDYECRRIMWVFLGSIFDECEESDFVWMYSEDDMEEANQYPDGMGQCSGVVKGVS